MKAPLMPEIVRLETVGKRLGGGDQGERVLEGVSLTVRAGEFCLILGPSGSGKTTLLTIAAGLQRPTEGQVALFGRALDTYHPRELQRLRARRCGFVFQDFRLIPWLTVFENVALVLRFAGWKRGEIQNRVSDLLCRHELNRFRNRHPDTLSHGQKQRLAFVRAVANGGQVIFADEPTASLDAAHGQEVVSQLQQHASENNACVIAVTHDLRLQTHGDRVFRLQAGRLEEVGVAIKPRPEDHRTMRVTDGPCRKVAE